VRRLLWSMAAGICSVGVIGWAHASDLKGGAAKADKPAAAVKPPDKAEATCGKYGTNVEFVGTPSEAAREAKKEHKLVFILHVSGHFEDPRFT
jgi:hypothetical protein